MSHTVTIDVKFKNQEAVVKTAQSMNARIIGEGEHRLFSSKHGGFAFQFPRWQYPCVVDKDGKIFYDNYNGSWGNSEDIETFQEKYAMEVIKMECDLLGWYYEPQANGEMIVTHPDGGTITINREGKIDANGFVGNSCEIATARFEQALGTKIGEALKPYLNEVQIQQNTGE